MKIRAMILTAFSALSLLSTPVLAQDYNWFGGTGSWNDPLNWSPNGVPEGVDNPQGNAYVTNTPASSATVFSSTDTPHFSRLYLFGSNGRTMTLALQDGWFWSVDGLEMGSGGIVNQTGGNLFYGGNNLIIGKDSTYNLAAGKVLTSVESLTVYGVMNQTGGIVGYTENIEVYTGGVYNLSGTGEVYKDHLRISGGVFNQNGGTVRTGWIVSDGTYDLSGGSITAWDIFNHGTIKYSGGELHLGSDGTGILTNYGTTNLSGSGTRTIDGNIENNGTFRTTNTIAYYTGTFTNNGAYISDPSIQHFNDLIIGQNGYMVGQLEDVFKVSGDLISSSIMNTDWNTRQAYLQFITGTDSIHDFYLTGGDFGAKKSRYANNFAWGTLDVTGNIVYFFDGNSEAGAALYLREIFGLDITDTLIANLFGFDGLDIYYMANLPGNEFLHGLSYNLSGGGYLVPIGGHRAFNPKLTYNLAGGDYLAPITTPEPGTMLLLVSGLLGLVGYGRRRLKK